jgi:Glycosyltransferase 61
LQVGDVTEQAPDPLYIFLGPIHRHYGHFLVSTLSRLWFYNKTKFPDVKVIVCGWTLEILNVDENLPDNLSRRYPYMGEVFETLGLRGGDFVTFDRPTTLKSTIISSPCFGEQNFIHHIFPKMFGAMQDRLLYGTVPVPSNTPIFLARSRLRAGISSLFSEEEFTSVLAAKGVEIIYPEQMSLLRQVRLFIDRRNISGFGGSALHTAAFVSPRKFLSFNLLGPNLPNPLSRPLSNQVLIDWACGHETIYLYLPDGTELAEPQPGFAHSMRLTNPKRTAMEFLRILDPFMRIRTRTVAQELSVYGAADRHAIDGVSRENIALFRPTRQSSVGPYSMHLTAEQNSAGGCCGFCTGNYQFCTNRRHDPGWDVDLGPMAKVEEIRLFNTLGPEAGFACKFRILISDDGEAWTEVLYHQTDTPFGGLDGKPFIGQPQKALLTRF